MAAPAASLEKRGINMKEVVEIIAKALVAQPEDVVVDE